MKAKCHFKIKNYVMAKKVLKKFEILIEEFPKILIWVKRKQKTMIIPLLSGSPCNVL